MSFNASARRARDRTQPIGIRVACLHQCLERFSPFGYRSTRERLRVMVGTARRGWTEDEVVRALDVLETAKAAWTRYYEREHARRRELKRRDRNAPRPTDPDLFVAWRETHFVGEQADLWRVAGLGDCDDCGHPLIHHGTHACAACGADPDVAWDERCRAPFPAPR